RPPETDPPPALGEGGGRKQNRGSVVVHDERRLRSRQPPQQVRHVGLPRPAAPCDEVVLEVRVPACGLRDLVERRGGQWRAAEVRVDDDAGGVQDAAQTSGVRGKQLLLEALGEVAGVRASLYLFTRACKNGAGGLYCQRVVRRAR